MELVLKNNAVGLLGGSLATGTTTLTLATGHGTKFPIVVDGTQYAVATLADKYNSKIEIVHITEHLEDADTMVILRARESTTANTWSSGDRFEMRPTVGVFEDIIGECEGFRDEAEGFKDDAETAAATLTYATEEEHLTGTAVDRMANPAGVKAVVDELEGGLGTASVQDDDRYAHRGNNLSDLPNKATARGNLELGSGATRDVTISTDDPSGGSDGDLWFKY